MPDRSPWRQPEAPWLLYVVLLTVYSIAVRSRVDIHLAGVGPFAVGFAVLVVEILHRSVSTRGG